uniref:GOLGA2L5 domain-containing protein n=1 Tax=Meloidogyne hapla TaxID=6305 RepID=A0A1I8BA59_MELHA
MEEFQNSKSIPILQQQNNLTSSDLIKNDFSDLRLASIQQERDELLLTLTNLSQQIETERNLSSNLEAKLLMAQQDKMDTQAHLKSIYHEKVQLEQNFEQCKKELAMRDIYLQQLSKQFQFEHLPQNIRFEEKNEENKKSSSNEELISLKLELENSRKNVQSLQEEMQITSLQANSRLKVVEEELETTRAKFNEICSLKDYLEESLLIAQATIEKNALLNKTSSEPLENEQSQTELDSLKQQISNLLLEKEQQFYLNTQVMDKLNEEKNGQIEELKSELNEAMERIRELERDKIMRGNIDQDASTLSIQLQNEKATVSRAIAQNLELKTQLGELQNRLVQIINSSAEKEDERLTAISSVSKLTQALNELKEEKEKEKENSLKINKINNLVEKQVQTDGNGEVNIDLDVKENLSSDQNSSFSSAFHHPHEQSTDQITSIPSSGNETSQERESERNENVEEVEEVQVEGNEEEEGSEEEDEKKEEKKDDENVKMNEEEEGRKKTSSEGEEEWKKEKRNEDKNEEEENNRNKLQKRLEQLCHENEQFRLDNQKLQYWLTAVETENESIGEYVALYRFQRGNVQKRIAENEAMLKEYKQQNYELMTQLANVCNSINSFLMTESEEHSLKSEEEKINLINKESHNNELNGRQKQIDNLRKIAETLQKTMSIDQKTSSEATCSASSSSGGNLQARCTGCVGCRGEITTL